jgi:hypothetical protein
MRPLAIQGETVGRFWELGCFRAAATATLFT